MGDQLDINSSTRVNNLINPKLNIDYIECPICKMKCRKITGGHLKSRHGITIKEFREMYPEYPTECVSHIKKKSDREKEVMSDNTFKKKRSEYAKKSWQDNDIREKRENAIRKHHSDASFRDRCRERSLKLWKDSDFIENTVSKMREANKKEYVKEKRSNELLRRWRLPEYKEKIFSSKSSVEYVRKDGRKLNLKSSYEKSICESLDRLNIEYLYEEKRFSYYFNGKYHSYYPDIYLPEYDLFIEIKPNKLQRTEVNMKKFESVIKSGNKIVYMGEDYLNNDSKILEVISSTTIPRL